MADFDVVGEINLQFRAGALQRITRDLSAALNQGVAQVRGFQHLADLNRILTDLNNNSRRLAQGLSNVATSNVQLAAAAQTNAAALNSTGAAMRSVDKDAKNAATSIKSADDRMKSLRNSLRAGFTSKIGYMLLGGVGSLVGLHKGLNAAIEFERVIVKIRQVTKESASSVREFAREVNQLGVAWGVNSKELVESAQILTQAGFSLGQVKELVQTVARTQLAPTFGDAKSVTEGMIAVMRQFRLEAYQVEEAMGAINAVSSQYSVESDDIISAVRRTGAIFASMGGDLNELIAVFSTIRETTREAPEAIATGLRTILTRLKRPSTINLFEAMGVDLTEGGQFKRPLDMIRAIGRSLEQAGGGRNMFVAQLQAELGGIRQAGRLIPLLENINKVEEILSVSERGGTSLLDAQAIAMNSLTREVESLKESFQQLYNTIAMSDSFRELVHLIGVATKNVTRLVVSMEPLYPLFFGVGAFGVGHALTKFIGRQRGGIIPGSGIGDHIPILAEPGEFMINKRAAKRIGYDRLARMNARGYQEGGIIGRVDATGDIDQPKSYLNTILFLIGALGMFAKSLQKSAKAAQESATAQQAATQKVKEATAAVGKTSTVVPPLKPTAVPPLKPTTSQSTELMRQRRLLTYEPSRALTTRRNIGFKKVGQSFDDWQHSEWIDNRDILEGEIVEPRRTKTHWDRRRQQARILARRGSRKLGGITASTAGLSSVAMLGGTAIQSTVSPTNTLGQAAGGALSMGGMGALIGSTILPGFGTALGGAVGALYGFIQGVNSSTVAIEKEVQARRVSRLREEMVSTEAKIGEIFQSYDEVFKELRFAAANEQGYTSRTTFRPEALIPQEDIRRIMKEDFKKSRLSYEDYINTERGRRMSRLLGASTVEGKRTIQATKSPWDVFGLDRGNLRGEDLRMLGALGVRESKFLNKMMEQQIRDSIVKAFVDSSQLIEKALSSIAGDLEHMSVTFRNTERRITANAMAISKGQAIMPENISALLSPDVLARGGGNLREQVIGMIGGGGGNVVDRLVNVASAAEKLEGVMATSLERMRGGGGFSSVDLSQLEETLGEDVDRAFKIGSPMKGFALTMLDSILKGFSQNRQEKLVNIMDVDLGARVGKARDDLTKPITESIQRINQLFIEFNKTLAEEAQNVQFLTQVFGEARIAYTQAGDEVFKLNRALRNQFIEPLQEARRQVDFTEFTGDISRRTSAPNVQAFLGQRGMDFYGGLSTGNVGNLLTTLMQGIQGGGGFEGGVFLPTELSNVLLESQNAIQLEIDNRKTLNKALMTEAELLQSEINAKRGDLLTYLGASPKEQQNIMERRTALESFVRSGANFGGLMMSTDREKIVGELTRRGAEERIGGTTIGALREGLLRFAEQRPELATFDSRAVSQEMARNLQSRKENTTAIQNLTGSLMNLAGMNIQQSPMGARGMDVESKFQRDVQQLLNRVSENNTNITQAQQNIADATVAMKNDVGDIKREILRIAGEGIKIEHVHKHGPISVSVMGGEGLHAGVTNLINERMRSVTENSDLPFTPFA